MRSRSLIGATLLGAKLFCAKLFCATLLCAFALAPGGAAAQTVKIGYIATLSGQAAQLGIDSVDGFKLALQKFNGKLGGVAVELAVVDDQLKPEIGIEQAKRLVEKEQAPIIVGTTFSNILMAVVQPITRAQVFLISPNAGPSPLAGAQCNPNFFAVAFQNDQIYEPIGAFLQKKGTKRVVALAPNYQAGKDAIAGFKHTFKGELLDEIYTPLAQLDFSAELARVASLKPDATFVFYPGGLAVAFVKQYDQAGLTKTVPLYSGFPLVDATVRKAQGKAPVGLVTSGNWALDLPFPVNKEFSESFKAAYGREASEFAAFAYDTALILDGAIKAVGGNLADKDALREAIRQAKVESTRGIFRFSNNHFPLQDWYIRTVVDDGSGTRIRTDEKIYDGVADRFASQCAMK
jgi:branched-chain amino acid transport system substrate-binding protein